MNRQYRQFGQGLTMRGNERPSIPTTGGAWGANYNPADISQRHFLMAKDMHKPTINTAFGLSTEQKIFNEDLEKATKKVDETKEIEPALHNVEYDKAWDGENEDKPTEKPITPPLAPIIGEKSEESPKKQGLYEQPKKRRGVWKIPKESYWY